MRRERRHVTAMTSSVVTSSAVTSSRGGGDRVPQMTALCLSASFCFLACVTPSMIQLTVLAVPSMILLIGKPYWNTPGTHWYAIAKSVTNQVHLSTTRLCRYAWNRLRPVVTILAWSSSLSVCLLVTCVSRAKMAESIKMPFGVWARDVPRNHDLGGGRGPEPSREGTVLGVIVGHVQPACPRSIFSTLFARGRQRCDLWLPV